MNIVYAGVGNPIQFSFPGYDAKKLKLVADCGQIRRTNEEYIWKLCGNKFYGKVTFSCFYINGESKKLLGT